MKVNATLINLYHVCIRQVWLHANGIQMEHTSDIVAEGKFIHETSYPQRSERYTELEIDGSVIDFFDARNKIIHEVKKSNRVEMAHTWQVKFYIWLLKKNGVDGVSGIIEYPKLRETTKIELTDRDVTYIENIVTEIEYIIALETCPERIEAKICKGCSYYDFCYVDD
ncbi:MAG: CRISPR-associated protein Cas4 [Tannerella sp.]|jgi:CRISPR-associated exonuclease Cas4|nr:CRISPR-associated protein Cas4 [Tannerella sp.]